MFPMSRQAMQKVYGRDLAEGLYGDFVNSISRYPGNIRNRNSLKLWTTTLRTRVCRYRRIADMVQLHGQAWLHPSPIMPSHKRGPSGGDFIHFPEKRPQHQAPLQCGAVNASC